MQQFQVNKYIRLALSFLIAIMGVAVAVDWTQFVNAKTAGTIVAVIGFVKMAYNAFAPGLGVPTIPTDSKVITQKSVQ